MSSSRLANFLRERNAVSAVEFALIAPVMIVIVFAVIELTDVYACYSKVQAMAAVIADLTSGDDEFSDDDRDNVFAAGRAVLYPYKSAGATIVVSSIVDNGKGSTRAVWSDANNAEPLANQSEVTLPSGVIIPKGSVIVATVTFQYIPPAIGDFIGKMTFAETVYAVPRSSAQVARIHN
jgi:Flp pilus assembly protein TadG